MFVLYDLKHDRVTQISDEVIQDPELYANQSNVRFKCVETDIDLSENLIAALRLDSDGETIINAYPGKTKSEQRELNEAADLAAIRKKKRRT